MSLLTSRNTALAATLVSPTYINHATAACFQQEQLVRVLLTQRCLPVEGWSEKTIQLLLQELAELDTNNFKANVGVGEREGRVFSGLVSRRHFGFSHGVGRSGDLIAEQPKAAGSSLVFKLCNALALDACKLSGIRKLQSAIVVPVATGMAVCLTLSALSKQRPEAKLVVWPRMDQKSAFKSIVTAGFVPLVVNNTLEGDEVRTNVSAVEEAIINGPSSKILCVLTTTSCFAPRAPDRVVEVARLCQKYNIPHVINNAFGLQSSKTTHLISEAIRLGRVDVIVQSTDKNFMVPVGGAIIASPSKYTITSISKNYPGRATIAPILDLFITLLQMGKNGYQNLLTERKVLHTTFISKMQALASKYGERILHVPNNPISFGITLDNIPVPPGETKSVLGSMIFARGCSGTRVVSPEHHKEINEFSFSHYGAHIDGYPHVYMTAACAIGMSKYEVDEYLERLQKTLDDLFKRESKREKSSDGK